MFVCLLLLKGFLNSFCTYFPIMIETIPSPPASVTSFDKSESLERFQDLLKIEIESEITVKQKSCEKKYYNFWGTNNQWKCCQGRAHYSPSRKIIYQCCGNRAYVPTSHLCCGDEIQKKVVSSYTNSKKIGIRKCCAGTTVSSKCSR